MVELISYHKKEVEETSEFILVRELANTLLTSLNVEEMLLLIHQANQPKTTSYCVLTTISSSVIKKEFYLKLKEAKQRLTIWTFLIFGNVISVTMRTIFLMVPRELRQNPNMRPRKEFAIVANRLKSFFHKDNYTNVDALFLFGY